MTECEPASKNGHSVLSLIDAAAVSHAASREARRRESVVPPVSVFRWWARRTHAVVGAIIAACETRPPQTLTIADPFSGGGTIPLAAIRRGHRVYAQDINPWASAGLRATLKLPDVDRISEVEQDLRSHLDPLISQLYDTTMTDGSAGVLKHIVRVACAPCTTCGSEARLFPHALVTRTSRRDVESGDSTVLVACPLGHLWKTTSLSEQSCPVCGRMTCPEADYLVRRRISCHECGASETIQERFLHTRPRWETAFIERQNSTLREFVIPSHQELRVYHSVTAPLNGAPYGRIPHGPESAILHAFGFEEWKDLYSPQQLRILNSALQYVEGTNLRDPERELFTLLAVGASEMSAYLSRWDRWYLKPYEAMAGHRFNVTTLATEINMWGAFGGIRGSLSRRFARLRHASNWCSANLPTTTTIQTAQSTDSRMPMEAAYSVRVVEGSSECMPLATSQADLIITDPPYHDDVSYSDLAQLFLSWLGPVEVLKGEAMPDRDKPALFGEVLETIFGEAHRVLKDDGRLILSFANRDPLAWAELFKSLQNAGFYCWDYAIVHSENEMDQTKRGKRSCTSDLLLELAKVPAPADLKLHDSTFSSDSASVEWSFLHQVATFALQVGHLSDKDGWKRDLTESLSAHPFLR